MDYGPWTMDHGIRNTGARGPPHSPPATPALTSPSGQQAGSGLAPGPLSSG